MDGFEVEEYFFIMLGVVIDVPHGDFGEDPESFVDGDFSFKNDGVNEQVAEDDDDECANPEDDVSLLERV